MPREGTVSSASARMLDVPPRWLLKAAKRALDETGSWDGCYDVLAAYYGVRKVGAQINPGRVPETAIACYVKQQPGHEPMIYSKEKSMSASTAFHEFGHHLQASVLKGRLTRESNEFFAEEYADAVVLIWDTL